MAEQSRSGSLTVVALLVVLVLVGTFVAWKVLPEHHQPDVLVIGDSVTFLSAGAIEEELGKSTWFAGEELTAADMQMSYAIEASLARGGIRGLGVG